MAITYDEIETKVKQKVLVDNQGSGTLVPFIRAYVYDECGDLESVNDTDLDGVPYVFTGTVEEKTSKIDFVDDLKLNDRLKIDVIGSLSMASTSACVYMNQQTEQTGIDNTGTVLNLDNISINTSPATIDTSTTVGEYIFIISGNYELELQITADTEDNARRTSKTTLQVFDGSVWIDVVGSPSCFGYHRNNASGENTSYNRVIVSATSNQRYRYNIECLNNGLIKTVPVGTSLVIKQI
tara:strand:+ start:364 stop:1080 length:717 start_codon:yes stop_codon:yes gene_type:complete